MIKLAAFFKKKHTFQQFLTTNEYNVWQLLFKGKQDKGNPNKAASLAFQLMY